MKNNIDFFKLTKTSDYKTPLLRIIMFQKRDIVTNSISAQEACDDLSGWNKDWFSKDND